jgi:hypothetical protein
MAIKNSKFDTLDTAFKKGPWVLVRLQPLEGRNDVGRWEFQEIRFRDGYGIGVSDQADWQNHNSLRAISIFFLLAKAKELEAKSSVKPPILIAAATSEHSWVKSLLELVRGGKKFLNSDWRKALFDIAVGNGDPINGLGKYVKVARKQEAILSKPLTIYIFLKPKPNLGDRADEATNAEIIRNCAAELEADCINTHKGSPLCWSPTLEEYLKRETNAITAPHVFPETASQPIIDTVTPNVPLLKVTVPSSVKVPVWESMRSSGRGLRLNLALRWALNRRPGVVLLQNGDADQIFSSLIETERLLQEAVRTTENENPLSHRHWFAIEELPSAQPDMCTWLGALNEHCKMAADEREEFESGNARLGIMVKVDDSIAKPQRMRHFVACVTSLLTNASALDPLLVIHTKSNVLTAPLTANLAKVIDSSVGLPFEALDVFPEFETRKILPADNIVFWNSPSPGQSLARFCQKLDLNESRLAHSEIKTLRDALDRFGPTELTTENNESDSLPHVGDIVADLRRIDGDGVEVARLILKSAKTHDRFRQILPSLIGAMAAVTEPWMRAAALEAAVPDFELVDAWLAGLASETQQSIPVWWFNTNSDQLESVLAALIRQAKQGSKESRGIIEEWLQSVNVDLAKATRAILGDTDGSEESFWRADLRGKTIQFLGECDPASKILVDEIFKISPSLFIRPEFWQLIQGLPLDTDFIRRLRHLPPEFGAVLGLCSSDDWANLKKNNRLRQILNLRGVTGRGLLAMESV